MNEKQLERILKIKIKDELRTLMPGVIVHCAQGGATLFSYAKGIADITSAPLAVNSNFRLASLTKQFTAVAILRLIEQGALSLATTLGTLFSDCPAYARKIELRHLLSHTSGLPDYETASAVDTFPRYQVTDKDVYDYYRDEIKKLNFKSGSKYEYSDGAYCLLSVIVSHVAKMPYEEYLQKHVLRNAHMTDSGFMRKNLPRRVYGFSYQKDSGWVPSDQRRTSATHGDGGLYSSAHELVAWQKALYKGKKILNADSLAAMHSIQSRGEDGGYGFGIRIGTINGKTCYYHGGSSIGFQTALFYVPDLDMSLVLLCNIDEQDMVRPGKSILRKLL
jgi:CubicO group peptidase (beta-lactamase class C family)